MPRHGNIIADAMAKGVAELGGVDQTTLILASLDEDLVGRLPADIQHFTIFTAAIPANAKHAAAAKALADFLMSSPPLSVFKARKFEPG